MNKEPIPDATFRGIKECLDLSDCRGILSRRPMGISIENAGEGRCEGGICQTTALE